MESNKPISIDSIVANIPPFRRKYEMLWKSGLFEDSAVQYLSVCLVGALVSYWIFGEVGSGLGFYVALPVVGYLFYKIHQRGDRKYQKYIDDYHKTLMAFSEEELLARKKECLAMGDSLTANVIEINLKKRLPGVETD